MKSVSASSSAIKQHCLGFPKKGKKGEFMASEHAQKVEKRKQREENLPGQVAAAPASPIVVQVESSSLHRKCFASTGQLSHQRRTTRTSSAGKEAKSEQPGFLHFKGE